MASAFASILQSLLVLHTSKVRWRQELCLLCVLGHVLLLLGAGLRLYFPYPALELLWLRALKCREAYPPVQMQFKQPAAQISSSSACLEPPLYTALQQEVRGTL